MDFGTYLHQMRKRCHLTQRRLASEAGVDFTYISKIEHGATAPPSAKVIGLIVDALEKRRRELSLAEENDAMDLYLLAEKFPFELRGMIQGNPLLQQVLIELAGERLSDDLYRELIDLIQKKRRS